jgi:hypothetical protein
LKYALQPATHTCGSGQAQRAYYWEALRSQFYYYGSDNVAHWVDWPHQS